MFLLTQTKLKLFSALLAFVLFSNFYSVSQALTCSISEEQYVTIGDILKGVDIRRTVVNSMTATLTDFTTMVVTGVDPDTLLVCNYINLREIRDTGTSTMPNGALEILDGCPDLAIAADNPDNITRCNEVENNTDFVRASSSPGYNAKTFSSVAGLAHTVQNTAMRDPIPVNLAFWWNKKIENLPVANTAMAATITYSQNPFLLDLVMDIWAVMRNIAYAVLAIIMLFIGIMIIMRKKLNQQTVLTVQVALPRIIIAVVLIAFSYPIGATLATLGWELGGVADKVASNINLLEGGNPWATLGSFMALVVLGLGTWATASVVSGGVFLVILLAVFLIALVQWIIILFKIVFIYIRMVSMIAFAPIIFSIGALPGNDSTLKWFKQMFVYMLSIPAMYFIVVLTRQITFALMFTSGTGQGFWMSLAAPFLVIYGLSFAMGMPKRIEAMVMGEQKRGR